MRRETAANSMHENSSRSHAFLTLLLERRLMDTSQTVSLHLIDLAGSETFDKIGGDSGINGGLLALGKVLTALAEGKPHVPYRDSMLTRLLQSFISGNSRTMMLACVSPGKPTASETANTLRYAVRRRRPHHAPPLRGAAAHPPHTPPTCLLSPRSCSLPWAAGEGGSGEDGPQNFQGEGHHVRRPDGERRVRPRRAAQ